MKKYIKFMLAGAVLAGAASTNAIAFDDSEKQKLGEIIRQYILDNPEILIEAQTILEQRQVAAQQERVKDVILSMNEELENSPGNDIIFGNPDGDVTIVEFFDYNCGFCKRAMDDMVAIVEQDANVKFVLKEFPILGPESVEAARVSIAVNRVAPEKAAEFHTKLLSRGGRANESAAKSIAEDLGIDMAALENEMRDDSILNPVSKTYEVAEALEINGTPSYVVGDEAIYGAVGASDILEKINNMRTCGKASC